MDYRGSWFAASRGIALIVMALLFWLVLVMIGDKEPEIFELIRRGNQQAMGDWLDAGGDPNTSSEAGRSCLMIAAAHDNRDFVKMLLAAGADLDHQDRDGVSALMAATARGHEGMVEQLLKAGADPDLGDATGRTALMLVSIYASPGQTTDGITHEPESVIRALARGGADLNARSHDGRSALIFAAAQGNFGAVELLLSLGADEKVKDHRGLNAWAWAKKNNHTQIAQILANLY